MFGKFLPKANPVPEMQEINVRTLYFNLFILIILIKFTLEPMRL